MMLSVRIDPDLRRKVVAAASAAGLTQRDVVEAALRAWMAPAPPPAPLPAPVPAAPLSQVPASQVPGPEEVAAASARARRRVSTTADEVRRIHEMFAQGLGYREIARRVDRDHSLIIRIVRQAAATARPRPDQPRPDPPRPA
jgi:hypothetical protein